MFSRGMSIILLISSLFLGASTANARNGGGYDDDRWSHGDHWWDNSGRRNHGDSDPSAPELDPTFLGSGIAILVGGVILLNERRRARK
jgi:hypothetical protein